MKIIVSHDIDHLTTLEHLFSDLYVPKALIRNSIHFLQGKIRYTEYSSRFTEFLSNKIQYIEELSLFNIENKVKSTFFMGVNNGLSLSYQKDAIKVWADTIRSYKYFDIGVHGITFDSTDGILKEFINFKELTGEDSFGIRMHYLRQNEKTFRFLNDCGYSFDSTEYSEKNPYKIGEMWEFPLQMMEVYELEGLLKLSKKNLLEKVKRRVDYFFNTKRDFLVINFHDRYFSSAYLNYYNWYILLIEYLSKNEFEFISFKDALRILESE